MLTETFNIHFLLHSANLVREQLHKKLADLGLSQSQARVIDALGRIGAASQATLVQEFGITPASMSTMTSRLLDAGYVSRRVDPAQARSNIVELTPRGQALVLNIRQAWRDVDQLIIDSMGKEDAAHLAALTRHLRNQLGGKGPQAIPSETAKPGENQKSNKQDKAS